MKLKMMLALAVILAGTAPVFAEYVFKKDGGIVQGRIVRDQAQSIDVRTADGTTESISRADILRIVYTELYLGKVYARLTSGEVVEGYQVYENRDGFFFRKVLTSPEEMVLPRNRVLFIVRTNPTDLSGRADTQSILVRWSPPFRPAASYKVFMRNVKANESSFSLAGETADTELEVKNLDKSWIYEFYATAINDAGEESLPSEKIIVKTRPDAPEKLVIRDERSADGKTATLHFSWKPVEDTASRVVSYAVYSGTGKERKLVGTVTGSSFRLEGVPAVGRHRFAVVAVNDDRAESADVPAIWDAGLRPVVRFGGSYIMPLGDMQTLAVQGYGVSLYAGLAARYFDAGIECGYIHYSPASEVYSMASLPLYAAVHVPYTLYHSFIVRGVFKVGLSFDYIEYAMHDPADPLLKKSQSEWSIDAACGAGAYTEWAFSEYLRLFAGVEYSLIAQKPLMSAVSFTAGVGVHF